MHQPLTVFHVDMNFVSLRPDYLRHWLPRLAAMGYNAILWELEDKVQWASCPDASWPEAMSQSQFREILDESRQLNLEPIPLLQTVGHAEYILRQPRYASLREQADHHDCYCTSNPHVHDLLGQLREEYLALFGPLRYFHLGGDEAYVFATCPRCEAKAQEIGRNHLYAQHLDIVSQPLRERGIRPAVWCDMLLSHPDELACLGKDYVIWDWNYWDGTETPERVRIWGKGSITADDVTPALREQWPGIVDEKQQLRAFYTVDTLLDHGYDVVLCSAARCAGDTIFGGQQHKHARNILGAAQHTARQSLLGHCVTSWAVRVFNPDLHAFELALASVGRDQSEQPAEDLIASTAELFFGTSSQPFFQAANAIATPYPFAITSRFEGSSIQWNRLKDGSMPPAGYTQSILHEWQTTDGGALYDEKIRSAKQAELAIKEGLQTLEAFQLHVKTDHGRQLVECWLEAGRLQARMNFIAIELLETFDGESSSVSEQRYADARALQRDFETHLSQWATPGSARHLAQLIFEPLLDVMKTDIDADDLEPKS